MNASAKTAEVHLRGYIGDNEDGVTDAAFIKEWDALKGKVDSVKLRVNSGGGNVFQGLGIYNCIKASVDEGMEVYAVNEGVCASMASVVFMAAPKENRSMYNNARFILHQPSGMAIGQSEDMASMADALKSMTRDMVAIYQEGTGMDEETVTGWLQKGVDTTMDAKTAKANGLVASIIQTGTVKAAPKGDIKSMVAHYEGAHENTETTRTGNMEKVNEALGLAKGAGEEQAVGAVNALKAKVEMLEAAMISEVISTAKAEGKVTDATEASFKALLKTDFANAKAVIAALPTAAVAPATGTPAPSAPAKPADTNRLTDMVAALREVMGGQVMQASDADEFDKLHKENPTELMRIRAEEPERFAVLYKAKYGVSPV